MAQKTYPGKSYLVPEVLSFKLVQKTCTKPRGFTDVAIMLKWHLYAVFPLNKSFRWKLLESRGYWTLAQHILRHQSWKSLHIIKKNMKQEQLGLFSRWPSDIVVSCLTIISFILRCIIMRLETKSSAQKQNCVKTIQIFWVAKWPW